MSRQGPKVTLDLSCDGCEHERSASYAAQGDSGFVVSCAHSEGKGRIGDTTWDTPDWCPLRADAIRAMVLRLPEVQTEASPPTATHEKRCRIRWRGIACEKRGDHDVHGTNDGLSMWLGHVAGITVDDEDAAKDEGAK